ncbi:MAG: aminotransferase class V-fold PLP-dependent enzyme, partial [Cyclobacteriaceae bacterium]|nr:aminotransferase class V-fold PLP-dependent enzyme [Cyclobacteriaceae bacterium]
MISRRSFFSSAASLAGAFGLSSFTHKNKVNGISDALLNLQKLNPEEAIHDEDFWNQIHQAYTVSPNFINLNNGGVSPQPKIVQDAVDRYYHLSNEGPSYYMWRIVDEAREAIRLKLSELTGSSPETLAVNRNATEALDTVIFGMPLQKGDEVVATKQDYPNMINAWKQRERREEIKIEWINLEMPQENPQKIIDAYIGATTKKTRVWHITHMINWNGQILPVKELCAEARKRNIRTVVDGAHTFAHIVFNLEEMGCDYFGTSLHKWLCAPFGTGMLYMRKELIADTYPLIPHHEPQSADIRKFEMLGTRSFAPEQAIGHAVNFQQAIGSKLKEDRLRYLKNYWCLKVKDHPKIELGSAIHDKYSCAIA